MPSQQSFSSHSVFLIPWGTSANNSSKEKVFHIMKVESKSISYHAFSLSFSLSFPALEYSSSTSYASSSSTTSAWGTDKGSENDTSKHKKQAEKNVDCTIKSTQQKESDLKPRNFRSEF
ncbi:hypothetical protein ACFX16_013681 [Malus domestica]